MLILTQEYYNTDLQLTHLAEPSWRLWLTVTENCTVQVWFCVAKRSCIYFNYTGAESVGYAYRWCLCK